MDQANETVQPKIDQVRRPNSNIAPNKIQDNRGEENKIVGFDMTSDAAQGPDEYSNEKELRIDHQMKIRANDLLERDVVMKLIDCEKDDFNREQAFKKNAGQSNAVNVVNPVGRQFLDVVSMGLDLKIKSQNIFDTCLQNITTKAITTNIDSHFQLYFLFEETN